MEESFKLDEQQELRRRLLLFIGDPSRLIALVAVGLICYAIFGLFINREVTLPFLIGCFLLLFSLLLQSDRRYKDELQSRLKSMVGEGQDLSCKRSVLQEQLDGKRQLQTYVLALIVPTSVAVCLFLLRSEGDFSFFGRIFYIVRDLNPNASPDKVFIYTTWFLLILVITTIILIYYFIITAPVKHLEMQIKEIDTEIEFRETDTDEGRYNYLRRKLQSLTTRSAQIFLDSESVERQRQIGEWRTNATRLLESKEHLTINSLNNTQFLTTAIEELILREERALRDQRNWQNVAIGVVIVYFLGLVFAVIWAGTVTLPAKVPMIGIPPSILMWGALGGLAAVLYRFYTEKARVRFNVEFRWLIARPLIGIIMGAVTYLAVATGLVLFGTSTVDTTTVEQNPIYWIVAFLAGFSDKFYEGIINLLGEKFKIKDDSTGQIQVTQKTEEIKEQTTVSVVPQNALESKENVSELSRQPATIPVAPTEVNTNS